MYQPWGKSVAIDLHGCAHDLICDPTYIAQFVADIIPHIEMKAHGPLHIERFGDPSKHPGPGYSALQFIETSSITVHMDEYENRAFIDIFSCKDFDTQDAADYCKEYFKAEEMKQTTLSR